MQAFPNQIYYECLDPLIYFMYVRLADGFDSRKRFSFSCCPCLESRPSQATIVYRYLWKFFHEDIGPQIQLDFK